MQELEKENKFILKSFWEKIKGIREEMSLFGKIYELIYSVIVVLILGYLAFIVSTYEVKHFFFTFLFLCFILVPLSIVFSRIEKNALKKYNEKLKKKRVDFCIYCNSKIDGFTSICPYCKKELYNRYNKSNKVIYASEIERKFREKFAEREIFINDQEEIKSYTKKSWLLPFSVSFLVVLCVIATLSILIKGLSEIVSIISGTFGAGFFIFLLLIFPIYIYEKITIISIFTISKNNIKLIIEKKLFYQILWTDIKDIEIFRMSFNKGFFLKFNSLEEYKLIGLNFCSFDGSKQKKIIEILFKYSEKLNKPISIKKSLGSFIDDVAMKELYNEIYNFARSQRFILKKSHF